VRFNKNLFVLSSPLGEFSHPRRGKMIAAGEAAVRVKSREKINLFFSNESTFNCKALRAN